MSNAMSISKSRWKGALLATVAASVLTPLAASAQTTPGSMTLSLSLAPMSKVVGGSAFGTDKYIAPDELYNIYVYATVTESGNIASNNVAGLQYAYFNVLQNYTATQTGVNATGINASDGAVTSATTSSLFSSLGSQNGSTGFSSGYYAVGGGLPITGQTTPLTGLAAASSMSTMGKARSISPRWSNGVANDGTNVYISGNTISFLLETLTYTPAWAGRPKAFNDPNLGENSFTVTVPNLPTPYFGANYFTGNPTGTTGSEGNGSVGTSYTHTAYSAGNVTIGSYTFSNTVNLYDAALGDAELDGYVAGDSLNLVGSNFSELYFGAGNVLSGWTNGDFYNDGYVGPDSLNAEGSAFSASLIDPNGGLYGPWLDAGGTGPFGQTGSPSAVIGGSSVPEPASLSLLALASLGLTLGRRSRNMGRKSV